jgi:hypothetical protein
MKTRYPSCQFVLAFGMVVGAGIQWHNMYREASPLIALLVLPIAPLIAGLWLAWKAAKP